jgi:hypothetical protein
LQRTRSERKSALAATPVGTFGGLVVENAGPSAEAEEGFCGPQTPLALRFRDDATERTAANGDDAQLILAGREFLATNIHSVDHGEPDCVDTPRGLDATWIAVDNSL